MTDTDTEADDESTNDQNDDVQELRARPPDDERDEDDDLPDLGVDHPTTDPDGGDDGGD